MNTKHKVLKRTLSASRLTAQVMEHSITGRTRTEWRNAVALALFIGGCNSAVSSDSTGAIQPNPPRQFFLTNDPEIFRHSEPDSLQLIFRVTTPDSTPHLQWLPTRLSVETDQGYRTKLLLMPFACLVLEDERPAYPFNFIWYTCDVIGINTRVLLSYENIRAIETVVTGDFVWSFAFQNMPGGQYWFSVPIGREATAEAVRRVSGFEFVDQAYRSLNEPWCVLSDEVPPPPCPPWYLAVAVAFSSSPASTDSLPVSSDGWVRVAYLQPDGTQRITTFRF